MQKWLLLAVSAMFAAGPAAAQSAYPAELAMPFETAAGKVVNSGDFLIFVNDAVEKSFAIPRANLQNVKLENGILSLALNQPVRVGAEQPSTLNFRFANPADAEAIVRWSKAVSADRSVTPAGGEQAQGSAPQFSYQVKHNHRIGSCTGRLLITADGMAFESLTDIGDSRRWSMKDIKEVQHKNPYKLEIAPFVGNDYSFELTGNAMKSEEYSALTKWIAAARR